MTLIPEPVEPVEALTPCQMSVPAAIRRFVLAGNAVITLQSERTAKHLTYKIRRPDPEPGSDQEIWFVSLRGNDGYAYIGVLRPMARSLVFRHTSKSTVSSDAPSFAGFDYFWRHIEQNQMPPHMTVRHEGRCGRCNRPLTDPRSIMLGLGPECAEKMGLVSEWHRLG